MSLVPGDVLATGHFASLVLRCGTACRHCFVFNHIQEPTRDSLIHSILLYNVIFEYCMLYDALVVTLWTCYGALQTVVL